MHRIQYEAQTRTRMGMQCVVERERRGRVLCARRAAHFVLFANFMPQIPQELQQPAEWS